MVDTTHRTVPRSDDTDGLAGVTASTAVRPIAVAMAILHLVYAGTHPMLLPPEAAVTMAPMAAVSAVVFLLIFRLVGPAPQADRAHRALGVMAVLTLSNPLVRLAVTHDPIVTTNIILVMLGSGVFLFRGRHLAAVLGLALVGWAGVAATTEAVNVVWLSFGVWLLAGAVLSALVFKLRNSFFHRLSLEAEARESNAVRLGAAELRYRNLIELIPAFVCTHDLEGRITDVNAAGAEALGLSREDLIGESVSRYLLNGPLEVHLDYMRKIVEQGRAEGVAWVLDDHGRRMSWFYQATLCDDPVKGKYVVGSAVDVTEIEAAREALELRQEDLERAVRRRTADLQAAQAELERELAWRQEMEARLVERSKLEGLGRMAGGVAHEFNNLLTIVRGNAELTLSELPADHAGVENLEQIRDAADRGAGLISRMRTFAEPDIGWYRPFPLGELVADTVRHFEEAILPDEDVTVELVVEEELPSVFGEEGQIAQVVTELLENAHNALPKTGGSIKLRVSSGVARDLEPGAAPVPAVKVEVVDDGIGIEPQHLERVFEPFFCARVGQGSGLGLSLAHGVVRAHHGEIGVESCDGGGTRAWFTVPCAMGPVPSTPAPRDTHGTDA